MEATRSLFIPAPPGIRLADKLLSLDERQDLIHYLAAHPKAGDVMEGTGGVRKLRWRRGGQRQERGCARHLLLPR
jgi:hypothetical protein